MSTHQHNAGPVSHQSEDQNFFNLFMVVIGALIGVTIFLVFLARSIASDSQLAWVKQDPAYATAVDDRIQPAGQVRLQGDASAAGAVALAPAGEVAAPVAAKLTGEQVYNTACFACHGSGVGGAPKLGDASAWKPRVSQGMATLTKHALEGFQGKAGVMPAKGGRVDLSDDEIIAAVKFVSGS
ncbi:MAG: c-type cytochrome [Gammaproteobacteria bacterium]